MDVAEILEERGKMQLVDLASLHLLLSRKLVRGGVKNGRQ
jgi:hypothetical protein